MTAEIAVMNKYGIALAADSAVSIGTRKIYNSANKLFALTKFHPVGVMVYGNAHFMGIPWETIIKDYRINVLKSRQLPTVIAYMEELLEFLSRAPMFTDTGEAEFMQRFSVVMLMGLIDRIKGRVADIIRHEGKISDIQTREFVNKLVKEWLDEQDAVPAGFPRGMRGTLDRKYGEMIESISNDLFQALPINRQLLSKVRTALLDGVGRESNTLSPSGLVVAGFGENEIFPSVLSIKIDGKIGRHLRILKQNIQSVSHDNTAVIVPFAQREMVDLFMRGADPQLQTAIYAAVGGILEKMDEELTSCANVELNEKARSSIAKKMAEIHSALFERLENIQNRHFVRPVLSGVASLPLDELAAMAESLVNLTTFKRRVTPVPESVGGPVDVAVISKGDGFIWIKRKHYFSPDLNPHFFRQFSSKEIA
ncbi:hypothetical protein [Paraburkholderia megapolitana]|uniref:hypothetical protein n=1 Tax=Paraburkholderia megapolitana TaxID=420953 RepID=UPI0038BCCE2A